MSASEWVVAVVILCGLARQVPVLPAVATAAVAALMPWLRVMAETDVFEARSVRVYSPLAVEVFAVFAVFAYLFGRTCSHGVARNTSKAKRQHE